MAVKVHVQNFQSISDAKIVIDGFTVVVGTNNTGKTSLQRALRGVFQNTGGTAFVRYGTKQCSVEVDFGDAKVKWTKGVAKKDRPTYVINDGEPIYPGASVPDEVAALGVCSIPAGGYDVWPTIASQFTGQVFLLDKPGSALAEAVADVERVGQLNRALRSAESDRRQAQSALKIRRVDLTKHEGEVKRYEGLDAAVELVDDLAETRAKVLKLQRAVTTLSGLRDRMEVVRADVAGLVGVGDIEVPTNNVGELLDEIDTLEGLRARFVGAREEVTRYDGLPDALDEISEAPPQRLLSALDVLERLRTGFIAAQTRAVDEQEALEQAESDMVEAEAAAQEALSEMGTCPVCGGDV